MFALELLLLGGLSDPVVDLVQFIDRSPTPYHAVVESVNRLQAAGYRAIREDEVWDLAPGDRRYAVRHEGSLVAFEIGAISPAEGGFRIIGAHTDSPNLRVKTRPDVDANGYRQLGVAPYVGPLRNTWLDRCRSPPGCVPRRAEPEPRAGFPLPGGPWYRSIP